MPEEIKEKESTESPKLPFILNFLQYREGAVTGTTTGIFNDIDCFDNF